MKAFLLAFGLGLALAGNAAAADLYVPQQSPEPYAQPAPAAVGGWYLRGDVGYAFNHIRGVHYETPAGSTLDFGSPKLDDNVTLGGGVGYRFSRHFRADVTADYLFKSNFHGTTSSTGGCGAGVTCVTNEDTSARMLSVLANAYVDIGTWHGITPYVGAGVGGTYVDWSNISESGNCASCISNPPGKSDWRFTYAIMAGASLDLTCNLAFDAGYRFRHVNGGAMFDDGFSHGSDEGFNINEVRGGLRYTFGGCPQPQVVAYKPAPVYK